MKTIILFALLLTLTQAAPKKHFGQNLSNGAEALGGLAFTGMNVADFALRHQHPGRYQQGYNNNNNFGGGFQQPHGYDNNNFGGGYQQPHGYDNNNFGGGFQQPYGGGFSNQNRYPGMPSYGK